MTEAIITTEQDAAPQAFDGKASYDDDSRVIDLPVVLELLPVFGAAVRKIDQTGKALTKARKDGAAVLARLASHFLLKDGEPDWGTDSLALQDARRSAMVEALPDATSAERKTFLKSIKAHLPEALLPVIVEWVILNKDGVPEIREQLTTAKGESEVKYQKVLRTHVIGAPGALLLGLVRDQYDRAGLTVPRGVFYDPKQDNKAAKTAGKTADDKPANPADIVAAGVAGLKDVTPLLAVAAILQGASEVAAKTTHPKAAAGGRSPQVRGYWDRRDNRESRREA